MHYVSQPRYSSWPHQNETSDEEQCIMDDDEDIASQIACICIITIIFLYGIIILLKKYEKEYDQ